MYSFLFLDCTTDLPIGILGSYVGRKLDNWWPISLRHFLFCPLTPPPFFWLSGFSHIMMKLKVVSFLSIFHFTVSMLWFLRRLLCQSKHLFFIKVECWYKSFYLFVQERNTKRKFEVRQKKPKSKRNCNCLMKDWLSDFGVHLATNCLPEQITSGNTISDINISTPLFDSETKLQ